MTAGKRGALRWLPTFFGFPLGGVLSHLVAGPVDGVGPALLGGAMSGVVLGAVQALGLGANGPSAGRWTIATGVGFTAGLTAGAAAVDYGTELGDLVVQGAVCGLAVGAAQAVVLHDRIGRAALLWAPGLSGLWALGWAITTWAGIDVDKRWTVFGSSGAIAVTVATMVLPALLASRSRPRRRAS